MMIPVMLKDGTDELVQPQVLDRLLDEDRVMFFKRSAGWVVIGRDPLRGMGGGVYEGTERRSALRKPH
jgi:hypothetical protein